MRYCLLLALVFASAVGSTPTYELSINADRRDGNVSVAPTLTAPAGTKLRYEIVARKQGRSSSSSQQSGNVTVGENGMASLSELSFTVGPQDNCEVSVKVYEGKDLVASQSSNCAR